MGWYLLAELLDNKDQIENVDPPIAVDVGLAVFLYTYRPAGAVSWEVPDGQGLVSVPIDRDL